MRKATPYVIRFLSASSIASSITLVFMFVHRTILDEGGAGEHWILHEDYYGPILFSLFFIGFLLFPLPRRTEYGLAIIRSLFLSVAVVLCFYILGLGFQSPGFHLGNFLIILALSLFGAFLFTTRCFQTLKLEGSAVRGKENKI